MDHQTIKIELRKKGYSLAMIAAALNCSPVNVQQVCKRITSSQRVANAIATALDSTVADVFSDVPGYLIVQSFETSRQERIDNLKQRLAS